MDLESSLGDRSPAGVALSVGALVELGECARHFLGLPQELLVRGDLGEALDGKTCAVADALAEGDPPGGVGGRSQSVGALSEVALPPIRFWRNRWGDALAAGVPFDSAQGAPYLILLR